MDDTNANTNFELNQEPKVIISKKSILPLKLSEIKEFLQKGLSGIPIPLFIISLLLIYLLSQYVYNYAHSLGFKKGRLDYWNKKAQEQALPVGKLLNHFTYEYRLAANLLGLGEHSIIVKKGDIVKTFNVDQAVYIEGDPQLSLEDNILATPSAQINLKTPIRFQSLNIGDSLILVARARHLGDPIILTQVIKMKK